MPPPAKRLLPALVAAGMWIGAAAIWADRARPAVLRSGRFREGTRRWWILPVAVIAITAVAVLTAAALFSGTVARHSGETSDTAMHIDPAPALMVRFGCAGCHVIPGIPGARGQVGPSLAGFARRLYVGGAATNSNGNLVRWLVNPRALDPHTAMPITGISEDEARTVAAYLLGNR